MTNFYGRENYFSSIFLLLLYVVYGSNSSNQNVATTFSTSFVSTNAKAPQPIYLTTVTKLSIQN